jgi:UDP-N-acetylmuramoylalanine--D-glutamate ligase
VSTVARGETAVIGLGLSGVAVTELLARAGHRVYASDAGSALAAADLDRLRSLGAVVQLAGHDTERVARAGLVVTSPGVPPDAPPLVAAREASVPVVSEIEIGLRHLPHVRYIAVTGTNGKTTTTALIAHLFRALGVRAEEGGNIGTPLSRIALAAERPEWLALEISSFQLHDTPGLSPTAGVLTNLSPDHLDRYPDVESYYADKRLLFRNASEESRWVVSADQPETLEMSAGLRGDVRHFSIRDVQRGGGWYDREHGALVLLDEPLLERAAFPLLGDHNVANALAATLAIMLADPSHRTPAARTRLAEGLRTFQPLAHRLEVVGEFDGVLWINDSKATNVSSTRVAVEGMTRPAVVLLGGRHKGEPYTTLAEPLRAHARAVIAYGEAAPRVAHDLQGSLPVEVVNGDFAQVIASARRLAQRGDAVLLSPACSSYDMFRNYEERGATFRRLAAEGSA